MIQYIKEFGVGTYLVTGFTRVLRKFNNPNILLKYEKKKYDYIEKSLLKSYGKTLKSKAQTMNYERGKITEDCTIWIFWWQGEQSMPPVVSECYKSVIRNKERHSVVLVTKDNIREYTCIPDYIYQKLLAGDITYTHFSDIVRENLLYCHGGIWMDATIYMSSPFSQEMYNHEYYSLKGPFDIWPWTGFFQASCKKNIFPGLVSELFFMYWKEHRVLITYLLIDCSLAAICRINSYSRRVVKGLPKHSKDIFTMNDKLLDKAFSWQKYEQICSKTNLHKLSYKESHSLEIDGKPTFWGWLLQGNAIEL